MERTISMMLGEGSLNHNNRKFTAKNVDKQRTQDNVVLVKESLRNVYHELFDEALEKYNRKQKRKDRQIKDYFEHVRQDKQLKQFYEVIVQIGNKDDMSCETENGELAKEILTDYMKEFQSRNLYLKVFNAVIHMDEATPHLHINFVPFSVENKRGLETQVSLKGALKAQGIVGTGRRDTEWNRWIEKEKEACAEVMEQHHVEWQRKGTHEEHLSVYDYKKQERMKEVKQLEQVVDMLVEEVAEHKKEKLETNRNLRNAKDELCDVQGKKIAEKMVQSGF